ncbi:MAG: hypothetical protein K9L70_12445 [Thiohalocapsa sp.]|nr:hypothetical protein [Thiohalocapsa sp.]MCF7993172.1 hypothetical protein [Thiohalocapsa sp.]
MTEIRPEKRHLTAVKTRISCRAHYVSCRERRLAVVFVRSAEGAAVCVRARFSPGPVDAQLLYSATDARNASGQCARVSLPGLFDKNVPSLQETPLLGLKGVFAHVSGSV